MRSYVLTLNLGYEVEIINREKWSNFMLRFILSQSLAGEVTDVVSDNVNFWSWDTIVKYLQDSFPTVFGFPCKTDHCDHCFTGWTKSD